MKKFIVASSVFGIVLIGIGFVSIGIPYPDPTPEILVTYNRNATIASGIMNVGFLILGVNVSVGCISFIYKKNQKRK